MAKFKEYKRKIRAQLLRHKGSKISLVLWTRYYSKLENAVAKAPGWVMFFAQPGDVIEITSSNFDYPIATIKFKVGKSNISNMETVYHVGASAENPFKKDE